MPYKDPEKNRERNRIYYHKNKEKEKERKALYYDCNKEKVKERVNKWRANNPDKYKEIQDNYKDTPAKKKADLMSGWRHQGVKNVNDELYYNVINTKNCNHCNKEFADSFDRCLDHDHDTGLFRQVLCRACNTMDKWKKK